MTEAERISELIRRLVPRVHAGTLSVFGDWFGRPHDNIHSAVGAEAEGERLIVRFDDDEVLAVDRPRDAVVAEAEFRIGQADRVRWEWFFYGRPKEPENRYFIEHRVDGGEIRTTTNVDWHNPVFQPSLHEPAVRLE